MRAYHVRIVLQRTSSSKPEQTDTFTPLSLWQPLPTHPNRSTARRNVTFNSRGKDYRFGPIALDWVDLDNMDASLFISSKGRADPKGAFTASYQKQRDELSCAISRSRNRHLRSSKPHKVGVYESTQRGCPCLPRCRAAETRRDERGDVRSGRQSSHAGERRDRRLHDRRVGRSFLDDAVGFSCLCRPRGRRYGAPQNDSVSFVRAADQSHSFDENVMAGWFTEIRPPTVP